MYIHTETQRQTQRQKTQRQTHTWGEGKKQGDERNAKSTLGGKKTRLRTTGEGKNERDDLNAKKKNSLARKHSINKSSMLRKQSNDCFLESRDKHELIVGLL
jgi:hypothetical protein